MSRKRDVFQLDDNDAPDANTSDAVGWSCDDGLGYRMLGTANVMFCLLSILYPKAATRRSTAAGLPRDGTIHSFISNATTIC